MKYTTKSTVVKNVCLINVYQFGQWWHLYEFNLDQFNLSVRQNFLEHIGTKVWGTDKNLQEIALAISNYKCISNER